MRRRPVTVRATSVSGAFAALVTLVALSACPGGSSTGIAYTPSSLLTPGWASVLRVRAYGPAGGLAFCQDYAVDETAAPGATVSLFASASTLALAPASDDLRAVRVVAEAFAERGQGRCDGDDVGLLARKVSIVPYARGRTLDLHAVFELSCVGVTSCEPTSETCKGGECVSASETSAGSVDAPCFDVATCPTLARATPKGGCFFELPGDPLRGYVAVTYAFAGTTSGASPSRGVSVLTFDEYVVDAGRTIELTGKVCEFFRSGFVESVYFGYACDPKAVGGALCPRADTTGNESPFVSIVTGKASEDGGIPDGSRTDGDANDPMVDGGREGSAEAGADGGADGHSEAGAANDAGGGDASEGGADGGISTGSAGSNARRSAASATSPNQTCCQIAPTTSTCVRRRIALRRRRMDLRRRPGLHPGSRLLPHFRRGSSVRRGACPAIDCRNMLRAILVQHRLGRMSPRHVLHPEPGSPDRSRAVSRARRPPPATAPMACGTTTCTLPDTRAVVPKRRPTAPGHASRAWATENSPATIRGRLRGRDRVTRVASTPRAAPPTCVMRANASCPAPAETLCSLDDPACPPGTTCREVPGRTVAVYRCEP
ncbi:MAG: hypothetical protein U0169_07185 [Polyangiaceae bacterium]